MRKMTEKQLAKWEKSRDIGQEILKGVRDIKAGRTGRRYTSSGRGKNRACHKRNLPDCWACQFVLCRTGSKGVASPMPLQRH